MAKQPQADMRGIHRQQDGGYRANKNLCNHCGLRPHCSVKERRSCDGFIPTLPFRNAKGTERSFSTFRLGPAWSKRLKQDDLVAYFDQKIGRVFGYGSVTNLIHGDKSALEEEHAKTNHLMIFGAYSSNEEFADKFRKVVRSAYGNLIYEGYQDATVIYLKSIDLDTALKKIPEVDI